MIFNGVKNMQIKNVSKKQKTIWILGNILPLIALTATFICLVCGALIEISEHPIVAVLLSVCYIFNAILLIIWPSLKYKNYLYGYDDKRLYISRGVIFKHHITAPICQIQDLHLYEGPVMRIFGIARIMFSTGGSDFDLSGIDVKEAKRIIDDIEEKLGKRIEVIKNEEI